MSIGLKCSKTKISSSFDSLPEHLVLFKILSHLNDSELWQLKSICELFQKAFYLFLSEAEWHSILPLVSSSDHIFRGLAKLKVYTNLCCFKVERKSFDSELWLATPVLFPSLKTLDVKYYNRILDWGRFPGSPSLETISISGNVIGLELITEKRYPKLKSISLSSNFQVSSNMLPSHISVRNLAIESDKYGLEAFNQIRFPGLRSVSLVDCMSNDFPPHDKIEEIKIEDNSLSMDTITVARFPSLRGLSITLPIKNLLNLTAHPGVKKLSILSPEDLNDLSWVMRFTKLRVLMIDTFHFHIGSLPTLPEILHLSI